MTTQLSIDSSFKWVAGKWKKRIWTLLLLVYISPLNPNIPAMRAIFFFGAGCWLGIWKYNMLEIAQRVKWSAAVFVIYASHEILILGWTKGIFMRVFGEGLAGACISYLGVPVVVLCVCLLLYWVLNRIMPKTLSFICGSRS